MNKLLGKGRIIGVDREVILSMSVGMVLPGRSTIPAHFGVAIETTVQTSLSDI